MAEQVISDLLMKFVDMDGNALPGQSRTQLPKKRTGMLKGFDEEHMTEILSFTFKTGLGGEDLDEVAERQKKQADDTAKTFNRNVDKQRRKGIDAEYMKISGSKGFKKFREGTMTDKTRYPVDMKPIEFERLVDLTSPMLLWHCIHRIPFQSVTLIKRKAAGGAASGEVFLRFDFNTVLLKSVDWDDGTPVKETVEFVCRAVTINYKPQLPSGLLGDPISKFWKSNERSSLREENLNG